MPEMMRLMLASSLNLRKDEDDALGGMAGAFQKMEKPWPILV
jgi:hypothetical protein